MFSNFRLCWRGSFETTRANPAPANRKLIDLPSHQSSWNPTLWTMWNTIEALGCVFTLCTAWYMSPENNTRLLSRYCCAQYHHWYQNTKSWCGIKILSVWERTRDFAKIDHSTRFIGAYPWIYQVTIVRNVPENDFQASECIQHASEDTQKPWLVWAQNLVECGGGMNTLFNPFSADVVQIAKPKNSWKS